MSNDKQHDGLGNALNLTQTHWTLEVNIKKEVHTYNNAEQSGITETIRLHCHSEEQAKTLFENIKEIIQ